MLEAARKLTMFRKDDLTIAPLHQCRLSGIVRSSFCTCILSVYEQSDVRNLCLASQVEKIPLAQVDE